MTRKEMIRRFGLGILGSPFVPFFPSNLKNDSFTSPKNISGKKLINRKPNVLFLTLEGVPLKVLSCYNKGLMDSRVTKTPNIDRVANEGALVRNSFCNNALCAPSRATLLTGKHNHLSGQEGNPGHRDTQNYFYSDQLTFPKIIRKNGYQTGMVGKWHLAREDEGPVNPVDVGFDYFVFKKGAGGSYYDPDGFIQNPSLGSRMMEKKSYPGYITDTMTDLAIKGMDKFSRSEKPFFMAMQFFSAHRPFEPPHKYENLFNDTYFPPPSTFWDDYEGRSTASQTAHLRISDMLDFQPPEDYTEKQIKQWNYQQLMCNFLGTLRSLDDNIGRLLDYLEDSKIADNTIVVITGDHGFFLGEHGWFDKRFMYEEAIRVPWIIRFPGVIDAGVETDAWVQSIDNAPTVLDMLGMSVPEEIQGKSMWPVLKGNLTSKEESNELYYHYHEFSFSHFVQPHYGIRTDRFKLIYYYVLNEWELFDLERDPDEMDNLCLGRGLGVKTGYENIAKNLTDRLKSLRDKYQDDTGKPVDYYPHMRNR